MIITSNSHYRWCNTVKHFASLNCRMQIDLPLLNCHSIADYNEYPKINFFSISITGHQVCRKEFTTLILYCKLQSIALFHLLSYHRLFRQEKASVHLHFVTINGWRLQIGACNLSCTYVMSLWSYCHDLRMFYMTWQNQINLENRTKLFQTAVGINPYRLHDAKFCDINQWMNYPILGPSALTCSHISVILSLNFRVMGGILNTAQQIFAQSLPFT